MSVSAYCEHKLVRTHTRTRVRTHASTHAHTHTHTNPHTCTSHGEISTSLRLFSFSSKLLRLTAIATLSMSATHVTRHTSHVIRHTSHITRHTSHVTRHTSPADSFARPDRFGCLKQSCNNAVQTPSPNDKLLHQSQMVTPITNCYTLPIKRLAPMTNCHTLPRSSAPATTADSVTAAAARSCLLQP